VKPHGADALSVGTAIDVSSFAEYAAVAVLPIDISGSDTTVWALGPLPPVNVPTTPSATMAPPPTTAASVLVRLTAISIPRSLVLFIGGSVRAAP
jgi:hypothetical protein